VGLMCECLWSDPAPELGRQVRGVLWAPVGYWMQYEVHKLPLVRISLVHLGLQWDDSAGVRARHPRRNGACD
jgi:hypothetical protein